MCPQWKHALCVWLLLPLASTVQASGAEAARPRRLPGQEHNRMVCIKTEGKEFLYVDMPGHWDLGSPSLSPDDKAVAFDALTIGGSPVRESWLVGINGTGLRKLVDAGVPRWSPDGKRLLITRSTPSDDDAGVVSQSLFDFDMASGKDRRICEGRFGDWSPDGRQIAFARGGARTSNAGIYPQSRLFVAKADGSDAQELCDGDWPSWSPDGKNIACGLHEDVRSPSLWIIDVATKKRERLGVGFYRAQWAADGKTVVSNGLTLTEDGSSLRRVPARFWLDKSRLEFFFMDLDTPFSPCVSRDGKTVVLIVDSARPRKPSREAGPKEEK